MKPDVVSLRVLTAYARDIGRGVVRIDGHSMDIIGVANGEMVEIIGKKDGMDARCYRLLPSDEDQGITRIDPALRKMIGVTIDDTVTIRKMADADASAVKPSSEFGRQCTNSSYSPFYYRNVCSVRLMHRL
jgi:transitional endoplasmic reticulum ATPase